MIIWKIDEFFNRVEELTGTYPDSDSLRSAVHAIITEDMDITNTKLTVYSTVGSYKVIRDVDSITREYETKRGISMTIGK